MKATSTDHPSIAWDSVYRWCFGRLAADRCVASWFPNQHLSIMLMKVGVRLLTGIISIAQAHCIDGMDCNADSVCVVVIVNG